MTEPINDPQSAEWWRELQQRERRAGPRYSTANGVCPVCGLGATHAVPIQSVSWFRCRPCGTAWAFEGRYDIPALPDCPEGADLLLALMYEIVGAEIVPPFFPFSTGDDSMFKAKVRNGDPNFDLENRKREFWSGVPEGKGSGDPANPHVPPHGYGKLLPDTRAIASMIATEPDPIIEAAGVRLGPWRRLCARFRSGADSGEAGAIADAMDAYLLHDPIERKKWAKAAEEIRRVGFSLEIASRKLRAAGDLRDTLLCQREEIDRHLARLGLPATDGEAASR